MYLFFGTSPGDGSPVKENTYVKVDIALADTGVQAGSEGTILATFTPVEGIHINVDPPVELTLQENPSFAIHADPDMSIDEESGFLSTSQPVEQRFSVASSTTPGDYTITGTIVYFFCSDAQGWCRKFKQPITLSLHVGKR